MKYSELIQFQPIESVIELRQSNKIEKAKELVSTYVISEDMADRLCSLVIPQLQYTKPQDNRGLLIVGNYGTGKSHLMSVISAVAENKELLSLITNEKVSKAAEAIAGKFQVIRLEIGSTEMSLRDIITGHLQDTLGEWGVNYQFPPADKVRENKTALEAMMTAFHAKFPDHGLLLVMDELLDYLRSRHDQPLILDLGFLREIGEVCKDLRFRIMAGVQEAIFDSGRFAHVADSISRVKDRFQQVSIASTDVKYVVSNRLLHKTPEQLAAIREYLTPFAKYYGNMTERMDDYAALFPIHPDYVETFDRIPIVEKRGVLQIISMAIKGLVAKEVPTDHPGVIAFDSYWKALRENPANRAMPEVKAVMECSTTLEDKVQSAFPKKTYKPMAVRIIEGLSVHRLTTGGSPIGLTPEELRDKLCLYHTGVEDMGGDPADDLLSVVETTLREIHRTVSGQFISSNPDNRQYYLDLKKTDDYDALVEQRSETLSDHVLDRYYYDAMKQVLEFTDTPTHITGFQIWQHEVEWQAHKAGRLGYLFFGAPNDRSTAVPSREFYIYFIQPFDKPDYTDEKRPDEVFFRLTGKDEAFTQSLKRYAAALELGSTSSGVKKQAYEAKAREHLQALVKWLRENLLQAMEVTYQGSRKKFVERLKGTGSGSSQNIRDAVNAVASKCLEEEFANHAPEYPSFSVSITYGQGGNAQQAAQDALRGVAQPSRTKQATAVLDALELLDGEKIAPGGSRYARYILDILNAKGQGQVVNRQEIITTLEPHVEFMAPDTFRLEPIWVSVTLAALVYAGDLVLAIPGTKFDATNLAGLATTPVTDLVNFKHVERPKDWNIPSLKALFELMDLSPGLATMVTQGNVEAVQQLHAAINERVEKLVKANQQLAGGLPFWGQNLFSEVEVEQIATLFTNAQRFLESLQAYNTPGKLKNFKFETADITAHKPTFARLKELDQLQAYCQELTKYTQYLSMAEGYLPADHVWVSKSREKRNELLSQIRIPAQRDSAAFKADVLKQLKQLKAEYIKAYLELYQKARLSMAQDTQKKELMNDYRLAQLRRLFTIPTIPSSQLKEFDKLVDSLKTGSAITERDFENTAQAPDGFWPSMEITNMSAEMRLNKAKGELDKLHTNWTKQLLSDLGDPVVQSNLNLLKMPQKELISAFVNSKELPDELSQEFLAALNQALSGLTKLSVRMDDIKQALFPDGGPSTPAEFRERFAAYLERSLKGCDAAKVRLVVESPESLSRP